MYGNTLMGLAAAAAVVVLSGCATSKPMGTNAEDAKRYEAELKQERTRNAELQSQLDAKQAAHTETAAQSDMFPPNPQPGSCYARVLIPAKFDTKTDQVLVREASEKVDVVPAQYEWGEERVVDKEASKRIEVVPATYETVEDKVLVKPAGKRLVEVPAEYNTTEEKVVDVPAHTMWKRGTSPIAGAIDTRTDQSTGEIVCLVDVPATYRTVKKTTLVHPAKVEEQEIPAEYKTVSKTVMKTPPTTHEVEIPATYKVVKVQKLVKPAEEKRTPIPAAYETVTSRKKVSDEELVWRQVVCETNMTADLARSLQGKLGAAGFYKGPHDGVFGPATMTAAMHYANAHDLPAGSNYITMETLKSLDLGR